MERVIVKQDVVTLAELKGHLRIIGEEFDLMLTTYLKAALLAAENYTNVIFQPSDFTVTLPFSTVVELRIRPITEVIEIRCGGEVVSAADYQLKDEAVHFAVPLSGEVTIKFRAGLDVLAEDVKVAVLMHASKIFTNPVDSVETLPTVSRNLLSPYKVWSI